MKKRKLSIFLMLTSLIILLVGCGQSDDSNTISVGGIAPMSGEYTVYGKPAMNGAKLAFEETNSDGGVLNKKINFIIQDDKGDPTEAANAYNKLVSNEGVEAIIGDVTSKAAAVVAETSIRDGIPVISPSATAENVTKSGENVFRACYIDAFQGTTMANFSINKLNAGKAAILYNTGGDYSSQIAKTFKAAFEDLGGQVVTYEGYSDKDKDFKSQLSKVKATEPDILFLPDYYNTVVLIATQAKDVGIKATLVGADGWDGVLGSVQSPDLVEDAYFSNHFSLDDPDPIVQNFINKYKEKYNEEPNAFAALGYDSAKLLIEAIKKSDSTDKDKVVDALKDINLRTVTGTIKFDKNRNPIKSVSVLKITDGKSVIFDKIDPE